MKLVVVSTILLLLALSQIGLTALVMSVDPESQEPPAGVFCSPTAHMTPDHVCNCTAMGGYMNCKDGKLVTESPGPTPENPKASPKCGMYCKPLQCTCCQYVHDSKDKSKDKKDKPKDSPEKGKKK